MHGFSMFTHLSQFPNINKRFYVKIKASPPTDPNEAIEFSVKLAHVGVTYPDLRSRQLIDSRDFQYNISSVRSYATYWQCTQCPANKALKCKGSVVERDGKFTCGKNQHNHDAEADMAQKVKIIAEIKRRAVKEKFLPASKIVNDSLKQVLIRELRDKPCPSLPKPQNMARAANRLRQGTRPPNPKDLGFDMITEFIPNDFLRADVKERRHLIFATKQQLEALAKAKTWYLDGTFKLVTHPFQQLFSIDAFIRSGECIKQVVMAFVVMSGRRRLDYKKVQKLGLAVAYKEDEGYHKYIRKLFALLFIPEEEIQVQFQRLADDAGTDTLKTFVGYINCQWIESTVFPPKNWCVYGQPIRTNNDVEGWHLALNSRAKSTLTDIDLCRTTTQSTPATWPKSTIPQQTSTGGRPLPKAQISTPLNLSGMN
ncbi:hypothetical protein AC249_AIPGENE4116 [Exaiptasia diaphana]|nr:hypothetical protein AC249_AIPGENE4116 [Exaiptasia diaphana]